MLEPGYLNDTERRVLRAMVVLRDNFRCIWADDKTVAYQSAEDLREVRRTLGVLRQRRLVEFSDGQWRLSPAGEQAARVGE